MAKIVIETDTETGIINCTVNGKVVEGVQDCNFYSTSNYNYDNGESVPCVRFYASLKPKKEDGVMFYQSVQASKSNKDTDGVTFITDNSPTPTRAAIDKLKSIILTNTGDGNLSVVSNDLAKCFMLK